ncbi:unnamed protein product, partial [Rotaria sordida]
RFQDQVQRERSNLRSNTMLKIEF